MPFYLTPAGKIATLGGLPVSLTQAEFELCCCSLIAACCKNSTTTCLMKTEADCIAYGGQWLGVGKKCTPTNPCLKWQCWHDTFWWGCANAPWESGPCDYSPGCMYPACTCVFGCCNDPQTWGWIYNVKNTSCVSSDQTGGRVPISADCYTCGIHVGQITRCFRGCPTATP